MKIIDLKLNFGNKEMILKLMLLDAQEFVMVEKQVMMKLLLNDLLMMDIGVCFVMELII